MEDVLDACTKQKGCQMHTLLATYKRLLKAQVDARGEDDSDDLVGEAGSNDPLDDGTDHSAPASADVPDSTRTARLLDDERHPFDSMVEYNPAVQAGIRRWLTDMRGPLIDSYENYMNLRSQMLPAWQITGLPEALLSGSWPRSPTAGCTCPRARARPGCCSSCRPRAAASGWAWTVRASIPASTRTRRPRRPPRT